MSNSPQAQKPEPLDPQQVRVALVQRRWTQARLAQEIGVSLAAANLAINHNTYPRVAAKIRKALNL